MKKELEDLEKEFKQVVKKARKEIDEHLKIASDALSKAEQISEETGIPFESDLSLFYQGYNPSTFYGKWGELFELNAEDEDEDYKINNQKALELIKLLGMYDLPEYEGWQHSAVCN